MIENENIITGSDEPEEPSLPRYAKLGAVLAVLTACWWILYSHLETFSQWITYSLFKMPAGVQLAAAVEFFIFEVPKVLMLLVIVVFGVGIIRTFFTPERTRALLAGKREFLGNILASLLGIVTPFCSCSAIPQELKPIIRLPPATTKAVPGINIFRV